MRKSRVILSAVLVIAAGAAVLSWWGLKNFLFSRGNWLWPVLGFLASLVFLCLSWLFFKAKAVFLAIIAVVFLIFFAFFGFNLSYLVVSAAAFLLFAVGSQRAIQEKEARIKLKVAPILKSGLPLILTGLSLMISVVYFYSPLSLINQERIQVPRSWFDAVSGPAINFFSKNLAQKFELPPAIGFQSDSFEAHEAQFLLKEILGKENNSFEQQEQQEENLYQTLNQGVNRLFRDYKKYLAISLAASLFFGLKFAGMLFAWLAIFLTWLALKLLILFKAVSVREKDVSKEVIEF